MTKERVSARLEADTLEALNAKAKGLGISQSAALEAAAKLWAEAEAAPESEPAGQGRTLDLLAGQLAVKDEQIARLMEQLADLAAIAKAQQTLQAGTLAVMEPPKRGGLWRRLFARNSHDDARSE